jgi:hypothetical protein
MQTETYSFMDGKVHVYKRDNSRFWQCSTFMDGRNYRVSTKEESLSMAKEFAREWYMAVYVDSKRQNQSARTSLLLSKFTNQEPSAERSIIKAPAKVSKPTGPTFKEAADKFIGEYAVITEGERNKRYVESHEGRIKRHLLPFFGDKPLNEISAGLVQEYRVTASAKNGHKGRNTFSQHPSS